MRNPVYFFLLLVFPLSHTAQTVTYDFEDEILSGWTQWPEERWEVTSLYAIGGGQSLKHAPTSGADKDRISIQLPNWDGGNGTIIWRFRLRHRFNPSGTNHWAVFLNSDLNAEGMIGASVPNGYAVGVNLTGTDDILRLYRVTNGSFVPILTSSINWETQIGSTLSSIGAVEVERKSDGTFTLKVATNGEFTSMVNQGSVLDNSYAYGGYFGIYFSYTTTAAGSLMVDDISFTYKPTNPNDHLTQVVAPNQQVAGGTISSLVTTPSQAINVFRFRIQENESTDGKPTHPTILRFKRVAGQNAANWLTTIGGVRLRGNVTDIPIIATYIMEDVIEIEIDKNSMIVNDNSSREVTLMLYLKPEGIHDGATIQVMVDKDDHGWEADFIGSDFAETFASDVVSNLFAIQVIATHLTFFSYPNPIVVNKPFDIIAHATDIVGNLATSFTSNAVELGVSLGAGELTPAESLIAFSQNGVITWSNISYSLRDELKLSASYEGLQMAVSPSILTINDPTSVVIDPVTQVSGDILLSSANTPGQAVEVFRFAITDDGANDLEPTYVRQIFIKRPSGSNLASFSGNIAGVILKANGEIIPIGNSHILTASISIPLPKGVLTIPDGDTIEVSMMIYLRASGLSDGANLIFMVDSESHNFIADNEGSTFNSKFTQQVISSIFPIEVKATRLSFSNVPQNVGRDDPFSVEVSAVDDGGSLDVNATGTVNLSKNRGDGWLSIPSPNANLSGGKAVWGGLIYSCLTPEPFNLLASSASYNDVVSSLIFCSDRTSKISGPDSPFAAGKISALAVSTVNAVEVFRFKLSDQGTTDGLPTRITQMVFRSFESPTDVSLSKTIGGVKLKINDEPVNGYMVSLTSNSITISFNEESLSIPDGTTVDGTLSVFLKKGGQVDGSTVTLHIPPSGHGWQTSPLGSGFPTTLDAGIIGPSFTIEVVATSLKFVEQPFVASPSSAIDLVVAATDTYGNVDTNALGDVALSLDYGPGSYSTANNELALGNGYVKWSDVNLASTGKYRFRSTTTFVEPVEAFSQNIWNGLSTFCHINEDFDGNFLSFPLSSHWDVSTVSPIDGAKSLKHALSAVGGESRLAIPLQIDNMGNSPMEWSFVMRNGDWDPSSDNTFWFVLAADSSSIRLGDYNGYAVGVNLSGTNDLLTLWRVNRGMLATILVQSDFDWDESETVYIRVTRTPDGEWSLWFQPKYGESDTRLAGQAVDTRYTKVVRCGPVFKYTSSRAGEFWLDNLKVCASVYPPIIQTARMLNLTSIEVVFSAPVNQTAAAQTSNYSIQNTLGDLFNVIEAYPNPNNLSRVTLRTEQLPLQNLLLRVEGISSNDGTTIVSDSIQIGIGSPGTFGNLVINEIMARPSPVVGLPNVEYIELYNRTEFATSLSGWEIRGNNNYVTLPEATVQPNGYIILSGTSGAAAMAQFGNSVGITSFPTLLVGGMFLALYDNSNNLISWVEYADSWYQNEMKKAGGYSLERIDPNNLVEGISNWKASNDPQGGTPGRENSIRAENPDLTSPWATEIKVVSPTEVEVGFSEPMDSLSITLISNYSIDKGIGNPIWATSSGPKYNRVNLKFASAMAPKQIYDICFSQAITDFSGNGIEPNCMYVALPEEPDHLDIVINEVLFNPYTGGVDFVEIFNRSDKAFDLNKMWIANRNRTTLGLNEFYRASETPWLLLPNSYAVLAENPLLVEQFYIVENPHALVYTRRMPAYPNDGGYVLLLADLGEEIDEFAYTDKMHNQLLSDVKGVSLERIHPDMPTNDPSSWQSAAQTAGFATPTAQNSQYADPTQVENEFTLSHQVFSPDGDGFEDYLMISYELPDPGYIANIMVFDSRGRRVKRLAANLTLGTSGSIKWDGTNDAGGRANLGAYVIFIEAFDLKGNIKRYKKTVVVATRLR